MSVVIETTLGDIVVDLFLDQRPITCLNFLKLCKMKYYNFNLFHSIRSGFIAQTGDPTGEGSGGQSIWGLLDGPEKRFFSGEKMPKIRHTDAGLLSMVCTGEMMVGSQFFFTLGRDLDSLDGVHCVIGEVAEGHEVLRKLNDVICDETHRPYQDVRITHTVVLEDPFSDPPGLRAPSRSPSPSAERLKGGRIAPDEELDETQGKSAAEIQEMIEEKEAKARATILEIVGDLPDADIAPPENVLFVCKLNPVTTDEDLEIIFSRFGKIVSCEVIRDKKTGDSLQYAFIEFADKKSCEDAYFKMDNVLIDDRRIHVDFSQSVSKMRWLGKGRGVQHFNNEKEKNDTIQREKSRQSKNRDKGDHQGHKDKYSNNRKNDDTHSNRHSNKDDKSVTKRSHRERSRSRSKHENSIRNERGDHSYNENKSKDHRLRRSDVDINREYSSKSKSFDHKSERLNRTEESMSRKRYEEKAQHKNGNQSEKRQENREKNTDKYISERREHDRQNRRNEDRSKNDVTEKYTGRNQRHEKAETSKGRPKTSDSNMKSRNGESDFERELGNSSKDKRSNKKENEDRKHESKQRTENDDRPRTKHDNQPRDRIHKDDNRSRDNKEYKHDRLEKEERCQYDKNQDLTHNRRNKESSRKNLDIDAYENRNDSKKHENVHENRNKDKEQTQKEQQRDDTSDRRKDRDEDRNHSKKKRLKHSQREKNDECDLEDKDTKTVTPKESNKKREEHKKKTLKKNEKNKKQSDKKEKSRKRKHSSSESSSDSDSSDTSETSSSSSSDTSSSSSDYKKNKRRKRKHSSSSSSDSSSSSSSDTSSSDTSSSSSGDNKRKKNKKNRKRTDTKTKKK